MTGATELSHDPWGGDRRYIFVESLWRAHLVIFSKFKFTQTLCYAVLPHFPRGHNIRMFTMVSMLILKTWKQFKCSSTGGPGGKLCFLSVKYSSVQSLSRLWLCDPMDCSTPGFPVHHQLPELAQTHVHWVSDAIQPSHPLSSPFPPALNLSQDQGLFQWVSSSHHVAKV